MKKKRKIDMYDPQIYPRKLWVAVGPEELDEQFKFYLTDKSGVIENIDEEFEQEGIAIVHTQYVENQTDCMGVQYMLLTQK